MTNREFLNDVVSLCALFTDQPADCVNIEDVSTKATELLAAMDAKNAKAKARPRKENAEVAGRKAAVAEFITTHEGEFTADEIAEEIGKTVPMSPAAVASAMRVHVVAGAVTKGSRKIDSKHSKVTYIIGE